MNTKIKIILSLTLFAGSFSLQAQEHRKFKKVQKVLDRAVEEGLSGVSVYINHPKLGEWVGSSGFANKETGEPLNPDHVICLASVGKTYAATAAMLMSEEGLLDLDAPISQYLSKDIIQGIPYSREVSVRQLMNMTSGFYNYDRHPVLNKLYLRGKLKLDTLSHQKALERYVYNEEPRALPGSDYQYSSTNYMLLAMIMDRLLGYSHGQYYSQKILKPLGLNDTYYRVAPHKNLAQHYGDLSEDGILENITQQTLETTNWFMGDDGVYATARDAGRFMHALNTGKIVNEDSWQEMTIWVMPKEEDYGLGLMTDKTVLYRRIIGHSGVAIGATADVYHFPNKNMTIALLCNSGKRNGDDKFRKAYNKMRTRIVMKMLL